MKKICLDYGHGGKDWGASYNGRKESVDVFKLGESIAINLERKGVEVIRTRIDDTYTSLSKRVNIGNKTSIDYFISIHRNAYRPEKAKGVEVFLHKNANSRTRRLAFNIQQSLVAIGFKDRGVKNANFYVLRNTICPAILIELGFIDNSLDNLIFDGNWNKISESISQEILNI